LPEIRQAIATGEIEYFPEYDLLGAWKKVRVTYPQKKKAKVIRGGVVVSKYWREYQETFEFEPGKVYFYHWQKLAEWEREQWQDLAEEERREKGISQRDGELRIKKIGVVEEGLDAAIRQSAEHKIASLTQKMIRIGRKEKLFLPGDARRMAEMARALDTISLRYKEALIAREVTPELTAETIGKFTRFRDMLERGRSAPKVRTREEIERGIQAESLAVPIFASRASADAWEWINQIRGEIINILKEAERRMKCRDDIVRRVNQGYRRLAQLWIEIAELWWEGEEKPGPSQLRSPGGEMDGIRINLNTKCPPFHPYYKRIQDRAVQRLARAPDYAKAGKGDKMLNLGWNALSKLWAIVEGEKVTKAELGRKKELIKKGALFT